MTGKERINAILNHRDADRIALDFSATKVTGIHCKVMEALRKYYGLDDHPVYILDPGQMLGLMEDDLADALGTDTKGYFENGNHSGHRKMSGSRSGRCAGYSGATEDSCSTRYITSRPTSRSRMWLQ